jgi:CspA family cold shock protein
VTTGSEPFVVPGGDHRELLTKGQDLQMEEGATTAQARAQGRGVSSSGGRCWPRREKVYKTNEYDVSGNHSRRSPADLSKKTLAFLQLYLHRIVRSAFWPTFQRRALSIGRESQDTHDDSISSVAARCAQRSPTTDWRPTMAIGTVKFFNAAKGFGFIEPEAGSKDVFVHITAVERAGMDTLTEGQRVSFDVVEERGKNAAANLKAA